MACSFEELVTDELVSKAMRACNEKGLRKIVVAGGVGANSMLREKLLNQAKKNKVEVFLPELKYCTDNAAMIGAIAYFYIKSGIGLDDLTLTAKPVVNI